jgi:hypothetical protein
MPCQLTIAAQLLGNGGKIEAYTIIIMSAVLWLNSQICNCQLLYTKGKRGFEFLKATYGAGREVCTKLKFFWK